MFLYREVASLVRLRPTLRTQLTLLYGGLLAALGGSLVFLLVPLQGSASVQAGPQAATNRLTPKVSGTRKDSLR